MKIKTLILKTMLGHVNKCKPNPLLEITSYYELKASNNVLTITATDSNNIIKTAMNIDTDEKFEVIVKSDQFTKLINKTTVDTVDLTIEGSCLNVKANGEYKVEIVEGETYPSYQIDGDIYQVNSYHLNKAIKSCKNAKSLTVSEGVLYGYLLRDGQLISADAIKVCQCGVETSIDVDILIPPSMADILIALDKDDCEVRLDGDKILFIGQDVEIYGTLMEGADTYPEVSSLLDMDYPAFCEVDVKEFLNSLDRLNLFVGLYDNNIINIMFQNNEVDLITNSKSCEAIPYLSVQDIENVGDSLYSVNTKFLYDLVSAVPSPTITICFGLDDTMKLHSDDISMLLAMAEDE